MSFDSLLTDCGHFFNSQYCCRRKSKSKDKNLPYSQSLVDIYTHEALQNINGLPIVALLFAELSF